MLFSTEKLRPRQNQGQGNWLLIGLVSHLVSSVIMHYVRSTVAELQKVFRADEQSI